MAIVTATIVIVIATQGRGGYSDESDCGSSSRKACFAQAHGCFPPPIKEVTAPVECAGSEHRLLGKKKPRPEHAELTEASHQPNGVAIETTPERTLADLAKFRSGLCPSHVTALHVSFVLRFALLHLLTLRASHRVRKERLLADFASPGVGVGRA
jgi:hypothetical protein